MDRFIDIPPFEEEQPVMYLKSNMDRFIGENCTSQDKDSWI